MKKLLIFIALLGSLMANEFVVGDEIGTFTLPDQFEKSHTVDASVTTIVVTYEKSTSVEMNKFLGAQSPDYLQKHSAVYIANISKMPYLITKIFAMPKMKKYKYSILLINDEEDKRFSQEEEKITVYSLENALIKEIKFVSTAKEIEKFN